MKKRFGKLVRDHIPDLIRANGEIPNIRIMDSDEYRRELLYKLIEEAEELRQAGYDPDKPGFINEIVDLQEVLDAAVKEFGIDEATLATRRQQRLEERGGFSGKVFLESVQ